MNSVKSVDEALLRKLGFVDLTQYGKTIFGEPDNSTGEILAKYNPEVENSNNEELGLYTEGDILQPLGEAWNIPIKFPHQPLRGWFLMLHKANMLQLLNYLTLQEEMYNCNLFV